MKTLKRDTHGEKACYENGCRCDLCKKAQSDRAKKRRSDPVKRLKDEATSRKWREENKDYIAAWKKANRKPTPRKVKQGRHFKSRYGLLQSEFDEMVRLQEGKCAICGEVPDRILRVDHDHSNGRVRELLCMKCNSGLGMFRDDAERVIAAYYYLRHHEGRFVEP